MSLKEGQVWRSQSGSIRRIDKIIHGKVYYTVLKASSWSANVGKSDKRYVYRDNTDIFTTLDPLYNSPLYKAIEGIDE
jgi:hypothetical protein